MKNENYEKVINDMCEDFPDYESKHISKFNPSAYDTVLALKICSLQV